MGVNLNTASKHLLMYVSGLGPRIAQNIIDYRKQNGAFSSREELKNVAKLGERIFEQCAGFLRIEDGANPLDGSAVHPESYYAVSYTHLDVYKRQFQESSKTASILYKGIICFDMVLRHKKFRQEILLEPVLLERI